MVDEAKVLIAASGLRILPVSDLEETLYTYSVKNCMKMHHQKKHTFLGWVFCFLSMVIKSDTKP